MKRCGAILPDGHKKGYSTYKGREEESKKETTFEVAYLEAAK